LSINSEIEGARRQHMTSRALIINCGIIIKLRRGYQRILKLRNQERELIEDHNGFLQQFLFCGKETNDKMNPDKPFESQPKRLRERP
jgi:hypothetical protein